MDVHHCGPRYGGIGHHCVGGGVMSRIWRDGPYIKATTKRNAAIAFAVAFAITLAWLAVR